MVEKALVEKIKGKRFFVGLNKKPECDTCKACVFGKKQRITLAAYSEVDCKVGDTVMIRLPEKSILSASFFLYALPLAFMLIGLFVGGLISNQMQIILSFVFLAVSFVIVWLVDKYYFRTKSQYTALIIENVKNEEDNKK